MITTEVAREGRTSRGYWNFTRDMYAISLKKCSETAVSKSETVYQEREGEKLDAIARNVDPYSAHEC